MATIKAKVDRKSKSTKPKPSSSIIEGCINLGDTDFEVHIPDGFPKITLGILNVLDWYDEDGIAIAKLGKPKSMIDEWDWPHFREEGKEALQKIHMRLAKDATDTWFIKYDPDWEFSGKRTPAKKKRRAAPKSKPVTSTLEEDAAPEPMPEDPPAAKIGPPPDLETQLTVSIVIGAFQSRPSRLKEIAKEGAREVEEVVKGAREVAKEIIRTTKK